MAEPIRYFLDQHIHGAIPGGLRQRGIDVLTAQEAGRCGPSDADQLGFATAQERVLVTHDTDFLALATSGIAHAGIAWSDATKYQLAVGRVADGALRLCLADGLPPALGQSLDRPHLLRGRVGPDYFLVRARALLGLDLAEQVLRDAAGFQQLDGDADGPVASQAAPELH